MEGSIWVGLFGVAPQPHSNLLKGKNGAYVNIIGQAENRDDFLRKVSGKLSSMGFYVVEAEDVDTIEQRRLTNKLGDEVQTMLSSFSRNSIVLGTFYTFDHHDA